MLDPIYTLVLKDSLFANFLPTINFEFAYPVMLMFGKHDPILASAAALAGSTAGLILNFYIFVIFAVLLDKQLHTNPGFPAVKHYINKFSPLLGILIASPQFAIIPIFFFGVIKMNLKRFLLITIFYRAVYYAFMLNTTHALFS